MKVPMKETIMITTDALGDGVGYSSVFQGYINAVIYVKDDYAAGVDFVITLEDTGQTVWEELNVNASKTVSPSQTMHTTAGVSSGLTTPILAVTDRLKIVVANGGDTKTGAFTIIAY